LTATLNEELARTYPGSRVTVLDANFPLFDGFPLFPHLSHDDGSKIDLAFFYQDAATGQPIPSGSPSPVGYFHLERPRNGDFLSCTRGFVPLRWELAWLQPDKPAWQLDRERTRTMILWWKNRPEVTRIFIEPYLAERLGVAGGKVRFQGCWAARHDDHLHIEIAR
jgi:hypothetical protein